MLTLIHAGTGGFKPILRDSIHYFLKDNGYSDTLLKNVPALIPKLTGGFAAPRAGRLYVFNGTNNRAVASGPILTGTGDFTICGWFTVKLSGSTGKTVIGNYSASNTGGIKVYTDTNKLAVLIGSSVICNNEFPLNQLFHFAVVRQSGNIKIYINGVEDGSGTLAGSITGSSNMGVGARPDNLEFFSGSMSDFRIYNVAKSIDEVNSIYNQYETPNLIDTTGLVAGWAMQEEYGTTAYDFSGNNNRLSLINVTQDSFHGASTSVKYSLPNEKGYNLGYYVYKTHLTSSWVNGWYSLSEPVPYTTEASVTGRILSTSSNFNAFGFKTFKEQGLTVGSYHLAYQNGNSLYGIVNGGATALLSTLAVDDLVTVRKSSSGVVTIEKNGVTLYTFALTLSADTFIGGTSLTNLSSIELFSNKFSDSPVYANFVVKDLIYPPNLALSKDINGNDLKNAGPIQLAPRVEPRCIVGNGTTVYVDCKGQYVPLSGDFEISLWAYPSSSPTIYSTLVAQSDFSGNWTSAFAIYYNSGWKISYGVWNSQFISTPLVADQWNSIRIRKVGTTLYASINNATEVSGSCAASITGNQNTCLLGYLDNNTTVDGWSDARISDVKITASGVTKYILCDQCGPGASNTNRDFYIMGSDGSSTFVSGGIVNGSVSSIFTYYCMYARDWAIQYGGGIAANGSFIPGRVGSDLDAAGNTKTLSVNKHGNPFTLICPNPWDAPSLYNIGVTSSDKLIPAATYDSATPLDYDAFSRNGTDGSDRYVATYEPLTGEALTKMNIYTDI